MEQLERSDVDAETHRLMTNWVRWKTGAPMGMAVSGAYDLEAPGRREETSIPLLNGEASDTDEAIDLLPEELQLVIAEYWLRKGTIRQKFHRCRCSERTFYRRLHQAHRRIKEHFQIVKNRRTRAAMNAQLRKNPLEA